MSWERFIQGFDVVGELQPATQSQIAAAEESLGIRLPQSYVDFIRVVGPGVMTDYLRYHIMTPDPNVEGYALRRSRDCDDAVEFALDIGNFSYVWNLSERSGVGVREYAIYAVAGALDRDSIVTGESQWRIADTFDQFILQWVATGKHPYFKHRSLKKVFRAPPYWGLCV